MISNHIGPITAKSQLYTTEAWGNTDQDSFLNIALRCSTTLTPDEILTEIGIMESKMGRQRLAKWGPRIIDIDILFYNEEIIEKPNLKIPHPELTNRNFVLRPLLDICPEKVHPVYKKSIARLSKECTDSSAVTVFRSDSEY